MDISQHPDQGFLYTEDKLAKFIDDRKLEGSRNVNFVGEILTPHTLYLEDHQPNPREYSSNLEQQFYASQEAMYLLDGVVDLYLSDFKYGNDECAMRLSGISNYWNVVTRNHKIALSRGYDYKTFITSWSCGMLHIPDLGLDI